MSRQFVLLFSLMTIAMSAGILLNNAAASEPGSPRLIQLAGKTEIFRAGKWQKAEAGAVLSPGQIVRVAGPGQATIEAVNGKVAVTGKDDTSIIYDGMVDAAVTPWKNSRLAKDPGYKPAEGASLLPQFSCPKGEVDVRVDPGTPLNVVTPLVTASVRGTAFVMRVAEDASSALDVSEGSIAAYNRLGKATRVNYGDSVSVSSAQYLEHLRQQGFTIAEGMDWRLLDPVALEALDDKFLAPYFQGASSSPPATPQSAATPQPSPAPQQYQPAGQTVPQAVVSSPPARFGRNIFRQAMNAIPGGQPSLPSMPSLPSIPMSPAEMIPAPQFQSPPMFNSRAGRGYDDDDDDDDYDDDDDDDDDD